MVLVEVEGVGRDDVSGVLVLKVFERSQSREQYKQHPHPYHQQQQQQQQHQQQQPHPEQPLPEQQPIIQLTSPYLPITHNTTVCRFIIVFHYYATLILAYSPQQQFPII